MSRRRRLKISPKEAGEMCDSIANGYEIDQQGGLDYHREWIKKLRAASFYLRAIAIGELTPVVHARWKFVLEGEQCNLVKCTHCGRSVAVAKGVPLNEWRATKPYCDQCGAKMDEKVAHYDISSTPKAN